MQTYNLGSNGMIYAPGVVAWAVNGYKFKKDRKAMVRVIATGWNIPDAAATALLSGKAPYTVEGETVSFTA